VSISLDRFIAGPDQSREHPLGKRGRELHKVPEAAVCSLGFRAEELAWADAAFANPLRDLARDSTYVAGSCGR
jgi:hypothetical protein